MRPAMDGGTATAREQADLADRDVQDPLGRLLSGQLLSRISGASPVTGNGVRLLRDGAENYPAWLEAIGSARRHVHFENYIFRTDAISRTVADALAAKAREGVPVRLLLDWMGTMPQRHPGFWRRLRDAGVDIRWFNPPRFSEPFGWLSRNHRKTLTVDGEFGFVSGLCVGQCWMGDPARGKAPWRDTGIALRGPAVADLEAAFADSWRATGAALADELPQRDDIPAVPGGVSLRVVESRPNTMGLYRMDQLVAAAARRSLWLTDAYFVGTTAYVRTLCDAARDGVDVRLLVPGASDLLVTKSLSRAGYRPLLEAGIRVFEWNGPMLHAKTAVADGRWARIGSSNLNLASWIGNWELDVAVEDDGFARQMEAMFEDDLEGATEIVLQTGGVHRTHAPPPAARRRRGSPGRLAAGAVGIGSTVSAAITNHRALGPAEARVMAAAGGLLLLLAVLILLLPRMTAVLLAVGAGWVALALLVHAWQLRGHGKATNSLDCEQPMVRR